LVDHGYKVAICEQTENGKQMEERIKKESEGMTAQEKKKIVKAINREVINIFTKGTHYNIEVNQRDLLGDYDTKHVLSFYQRDLKFGYCYFDMSTLRF
jgi:DNA mismatch repair ATPase MutS